MPNLTVDTPRPEYPRPDRDRSERWLNLNGTWEFAEDPAGTLTLDEVRVAERLPATIVVPFAWETVASTVERTWLESAWYRRVIDVPAEWSGERIILCFGAVHHRAQVWVGEELVADHSGGYVPFEVDITDHLAEGRPTSLVLRVEAPHDKRFLIHGKQRSLPRDDYDGVSFTPTSGIWQTVWVEPRPATHVEVVALRGDSLTGIDAEVRVVGPDRASAVVRLAVQGGPDVECLTDVRGVARAFLPLADPRLWRPTDPHLYRVEVTVDSGSMVDRLTAWAGLRKIEWDSAGLRLNGERLHVRGVLDQGYWPRTGITAPSDDALRHDIELAAECGFNLVRKHLKFEDPRWLDWADRIGMLVWAEPACASRYSRASVTAFNEQIPLMVERDGNHPSIVIWGLYNEEWGFDWDLPSHENMRQDAAAAYDILSALDHSRPIVENSGWNHVKTDLLDWHCYIDDPASWRSVVEGLADGTRDSIPVPLGPDWIVEKRLFATPQDVVPGLPLINSEYGGGDTNLERGWQLRWQTQELRRHDRLAGYVYCEITDIEHETAGLYYTDRTLKDLSGARPADVNADTTLIFDVLPLQAGADIAITDESFSLPVRASHHGMETLDGLLYAAWVPAHTPMASASPSAPVVASAPIVAEPFKVSDATVLQVPPPPGGKPARLVVWLAVQRNAQEEVLARGFLDAGVLEQVTGEGWLERP